MAAFFIAQYSVNDPALYAEYSAGAGPTLAKYGAELVAFDVAAETIEGEPPGGTNRHHQVRIHRSRKAVVSLR